MRARRKISPRAGPHRGTGERLERFRLAKGIATHQAFISGAGISHSTYADVENGRKPLGIKTAMKLIKRHPELSLDYIYLGRIGTIDGYDLRERIIALSAAAGRDKP